MGFRKRYVVLGLPALVALVVVALFAWGLSGSDFARAGVAPPPTPQPAQMSLEAHGPGVECDGLPSVNKGDVAKPGKCVVPLGGSFTLSISVNILPVGGSGTPGYRGIQTQIAFDDLTYKETPSGCAEWVWPDFSGGLCSITRVINESPPHTIVAHAELSSGFGAFTSTHLGNVIELTINCTAGDSVNKVALTAATGGNPLGSSFQDADGVEFPAKAVGTQSVDLDGDSTAEAGVAIADALTINCVAAAAGLDSDGDGCTNQAELGLDPAQGGQRNPNNFWDFFDTPNRGNTRDRTINLSDLFGVASRFAAVGDPSGDPLAGPVPASPAYHTGFDRGGRVGASIWNQAPADGSINVGDIFAVIQQFGHSCA